MAYLTIDHLLDDLCRNIALRHTATLEGYQRRRVVDDQAIGEAKAVLKSLFETMMAEVVGEDEEQVMPSVNADNFIAVQRSIGRNQEKDDQRQRIPQVITKYFDSGKE